MDRHSVVLRIMAESFDMPLDEFLSSARLLGYLDENNRPTQLGLNMNLYQRDYLEPQQINNFNDDFETYVYFHQDTPIIANIRKNERANFVDAKSFATLTGYCTAEDLMTDNNIMLDIMNMVKSNTGESLMERLNIDGAEKEYFKIDLYLSWVKNHFNK